MRAEPRPPRPAGRAGGASAARSRRSSARVLDAATDLFYERGFANTTLDDVAARLGVTKPFIYAHVGSKSALLGEISALGVARALEVADAALAGGGEPDEALRAVVPAYVTVVLRSQKSITINIREEKNLDPADAARLAELRQGFMARVEALLARGVERGQVAVPDVRIAAFALVGAVSWTTFCFNPAGTLSIEEVSDWMTWTILDLARAERMPAA